MDFVPALDRHLRQAQQKPLGASARRVEMFDEEGKSHGRTLFLRKPQQAIT